MKRSKHNLSHHRLLSFNQGELVPCGVVEVLPGDTFRHSSSVLLRSTPLVNPVMHPVDVRVHHFFTPARTAYDWKYDSPGAWEDFINNAAPTHDTQDLKNLDITTPTAGTLANHLGLPLVAMNMEVNFLPFVMYNMIYNTFYRDHEIQTELASSNTTLQRVCWEKDYFTTCRTNAQYGATTMSIPFSAAKAPVLGIGHDTTPTRPIIAGESIRQSDGSTATAANTDGNRWYRAEQDDDLYIKEGPVGTLGGVTFPGIYADIGQATGGINVNDFRRYVALQRFLENRSRFGSRYRDYLSYLGVRSRDGRIDEPEYLGGGKQTIAFSEVLSTADGTTAEVGTLAGHGIAALRTRPYTRFFEEHGYVMSLISVRPRTMYQEGLHRHWLRDSRDDFWQKEYEMFGPQAVTNKEVYAAAADETGVFGYTDRFREYREQFSYVSGLFGSTDDDWHYAREFGSTPTLNSSFVTCSPTDRVYQDTNDTECRAMVRHSLVARRLVSKFPRV